MTIYESQFAPIDVPDIGITPFILRHAERLADKPALIDGPTGRTMTYGALATSIRAFAGGLAARGFGKGDVLAIMAPNLPEYATVFHGTLWAGGTVTTVNPTYTAAEVKHQLETSGATILVTITAFADVAKEGAVGTKVKDIATIDPGDGLNLADLMGAPMAEPVAVATTGVACLPFSSGTTGLSKGVMLSHRNLVANLIQTDAVLPIEEGEVALAFLPFFHIYGMQVLMNQTLAGGGVVITMPRFDLELFLKLAQEHKPKRVCVVPPVVLAMAKHPLVDKYDLSALECLFSGAAPLGAELGAEAAKRLGCEVAQGYGMTELSPVTHASPEGKARPGTIGVLIPSTEARLVDPDTGKDLEVGEDGELWIRGPQVMLGYLNNEQATKDTVDSDGWLHTGDIGHVDGEGYFTLVDRLKELIKYKGFQVPPAELEGLLVTHPAVADAAVIGVPDEEAGELPKAFITLKPGAEASAQDIQKFVADRVAHYKQVRLLEFIDAIPKSASGKILRRQLRDASK